jgi:hypothetical protein
MTTNRGWRLYFAITNFKILFVGVVALAAGLALLYLGGTFSGFWARHAGGQALINNLGAILVVSVALGAVWELMGKRSFAREVMERMGVSADLDTAGIEKIGTQWLQDADWIDLFKNVRDLDIFVAYGDTWRNAHLGQLQDVARRRGSRMRIYLADPDHEQTVDILASRFDLAPDELRRRIVRTKQQFETMGSLGDGDVSVYYFQGDRVFSFYRFDDRAVLTLYRHAKGRSAMIPTIVCQEGGSFYAFIQSELDNVAEVSRAAS